MTAFEEYARVRIESDRFEAEGAPRGSIGYILTDYADGNYEVEVSDPATGETLAEFVAAAAELRPA